MYAHPNHRGFTVRELLAVIAVIGLVLTILMASFRPRGCIGSRSSTCRNNMKQVALAIYQYESNQNHYPGFHDSVVDSSGQRFSRPLMFMLMPYLERDDVYQAFGPDRHPHHGIPGLH